MIEEIIEGLVNQAIETELIEERDRIYACNRVLSLLGLQTFREPGSAADDTIPNLVDTLVAYAVSNGAIEDVLDDKERFAADLMNVFLPRPSDIQKTFYEKYAESPKAATDYFYELSKNSNYIQMNRIRKNISYQAETEYGTMDITINLSKPEKDPEQIRREKELKQDGNYPLCLLCKENEGYAGRTGHPARANHRIIPVELGGEEWYLQYSPYVYYNEHSILLSAEHRDMKIDQKAFERLLGFVEQFPHYFIGSNADLPIVGGSILSHDHYQAGRYEFGMTRAADAFTFILEGHPDVSASVVKWPMSVIRLRCGAIQPLVEAADGILGAWKSYSDSEANIIAVSHGTPHNTITPIARKRGGLFELDLVLRNNLTSEEHPMGIFHPHADVHHIKKENIGLIEVMGLAVLPPRLKEELQQIKLVLLGQPAEVAPAHQAWADELQKKYGTIASEAEAAAAVNMEVGRKFVRVLEDAGVFKTEAAFQRFIQSLNKMNVPKE